MVTPNRRFFDIPFGSAHRTDGQNANVDATSPTTQSENHDLPIASSCSVIGTFTVF